MAIIWTMDWQRHQQIHKRVLHKLEVLIVAEEEKQIGYVPY
jgi:hypothetical protein